MTTIKDVAARAGVGVGTASRVLSGRGPASAAARVAVEAAAAELRFVTNGPARSLRRSRTDVLGLLVSDIRNPFFADLAHGAEREARAAGFTILLANVDEDPEQEQRYLRAFGSQRVDGMLIAPQGHDSTALAELVASERPVVFVDRTLAELDVPSVTSDNAGGVRAAVEHLVAQGHRTIGYVSGPRTVSTSVERLDAFHAACTELGVVVGDLDVAHGDYQAASGETATARLLDAGSRPTALLTADGLMALGARTELRRRGLGRPRPTGRLVGRQRRRRDRPPGRAPAGPAHGGRDRRLGRGPHPLRGPLRGGIVTPGTAPRRVVVVGSVNRDLVVRTPRHPAPGETVIGTELEQGVGGKGLNQAVAARRAGAEVVLVAAVGDDDAGLDARAFLEQEGIDASTLVTLPTAATGHAVVTVAQDGENSIVVLPGANAVLDVEHLRRGLADLHRDDVVVLQHELTGATTVAAAAIATAAGATVVWNAAPAPVDRADVPLDVDLVVVNEHELDVVAGLLGLADDGRDGTAAPDPRLLRARAVGERLGAVVVCTLGGEGSLVVDGERHESVPAARVDVVDTTAAGDTFIGYLACTLGAGPVSALDLAVAGAAAGITVGRAGAATSVPRRAEVDEALRATSGTGSPTPHAVPAT